MSAAASGKKRPASPSAAGTKDFFDVEISDEVHKQLDEIGRDVLRADLANEYAALKRLAPVYKKRRELVKTVPKFWPVALMNHSSFAPHLAHVDDQKALIALEDLWVERDPIEPRTFTLEFHFGDNPYFSDKVLKKEYKYMAPPAAKDEKPDEDGITESMLDFDWERDIAPQKIEINWKSDAVKLTKLHPLVMDDGDVSDPGSFFNFFEQEDDQFDLGMLIANDIFPEAVGLYTGKYEMNLTDDEDSEDEEEDDDDDDAEEIDLEKPEPKKQRKA